MIFRWFKLIVSSIDLLALEKNRQDNWMTAKEMFEKSVGIHFDLAKTFGRDCNRANNNTMKSW